jgi:hypothetical protein
MDTKPVWIMGQFFLWVMVVAIVIMETTALRQAGGALSAQQAAAVGGRSAYGVQQGYVQAGSGLSSWWGIDPGQIGQAAEVVHDVDRRSLIVCIRGTVPTLFSGRADLGVGTFRRVERFYAGPPAGFE